MIAAFLPAGPVFGSGALATETVAFFGGAIAAIFGGITAVFPGGFDRRIESDRMADERIRARRKK
jgi:hypothetical protein